MEQLLTHCKGILGSDFKAGAEKRSMNRQSGSLLSAMRGVYVSSVSCERIPHLAVKDLLMTEVIFQSFPSMERSLECHLVISEIPRFLWHANHNIPANRKV
jgi:hypothetical protein